MIKIETNEKVKKIIGFTLSSPYGDGKVFGQPKGVKSLSFIEVKSESGLSGFGETYSGIYAPALVPHIVDYLSPLEVFLIKNSTLPKMVVGFSSTALITLDKIFNSRQNKKIEILSNMIKCESSKTDLYNNLYDYLRNYNIKINKDALQYI